MDPHGRLSWHLSAFRVHIISHRQSAEHTVDAGLAWDTIRSEVLGMQVFTAASWRTTRSSMHCSAVVYARQSSTTTGSVLVANDNGLLHGRRAACFKRTPGICRRRFLQRHSTPVCVSMSDSICIIIRRPTQPLDLSGMENDYPPKCGETPWLWTKAGKAHSNCGLTMWEQVRRYNCMITHPIPTRLRDKHHI